VTVKLTLVDKEVLCVLLGRKLFISEILSAVNANRAKPIDLVGLRPVLAKLTRHGWASWDWGDKRKPGKSGRRCYQVTQEGLELLKQSLSRFILWG
jgi:DNA-binding PadR family transcriptional regulator